MNKPQKRCEEIVYNLIKSEPGVFKDLNTKTLARMFGVHRSYLSRTFKEYQGVSLNEYINRLKMLKSALLLMEKKNLKIVDIAEYFGWDRPDGFINAFKRFFGISPEKFRKWINKLAPLNPPEQLYSFKLDEKQKTEGKTKNDSK